MAGDAFVVDANACLSWLLREPDYEEVGDRLEVGSLVVPDLWPLEILNTLLVRERQKRMKAEEAADALRLLTRLDVEVVAVNALDDPQAFLDFARPHQLSSYDATYLRLAADRGLPLLTFDNNLRLAAGRVGVELA